MPLTIQEEDWLIESRARRITKTVRLDTTLIEGIKRGQLSDILNLSLKRYLEAKVYEGKQSQEFAKEDAESSSN